MIEVLRCNYTYYICYNSVIIRMAVNWQKKIFIIILELIIYFVLERTCL